LIVLTTYAGDAQARRAIKVGARGYLLKNLLHKELLQTIRAVHAGRKAIAVEVAAQVAAYWRERFDPKRNRGAAAHRLRECQPEIAAQLSITEETVKSRVKNILDKLGANDRTRTVTTGLK
jgi:DNA-binding NarL/FixJ family response regulator